MLPVNARALLAKIDRVPGRRFASRVPMDAGVHALLGEGTKATDARMLKLFSQDLAAFDAKTRRVVSTRSHLAMDETIKPKDQSAIFPDSIEQCMEFAMRYCRELRAKFGKADGGFGSTWTLQINPAKEVEAMADGVLKKPGFTAYRNGGAVPPRAGDVLSMQSPVAPGEQPRHFHIAMIADVYQKGKDWFARVYEANVPKKVNHPDPKMHYAELKLSVKDGAFAFDRVMTSRKGYTTDMDVVGWIHPLREKALPGAEGIAGTLAR